MIANSCHPLISTGATWLKFKIFTTLMQASEERTIKLQTKSNLDIFGNTSNCHKVATIGKYAFLHLVVATC